MADNLTVQITADTSKLRADLKLAQVEVQRLNKEMTAAARQASQTGDRSQLDRLAREADNAARSYANLNRQLRATNEQAGQTSLWSAASNAVRGLNTELIALARTTAGGLGFSSLANLIGKTADEILRLRRQSQATGFDPTAIKAFNETLEDTGAEAGSGDRALLKLSDAYSKVRQDARAAGEAVGQGVKIIRGGSKEMTDAAREAQQAQEQAMGVTILRAGQRTEQTVKDAKSAFAALRVEWQKFPQTMEGRTDFLQAIIDGFARLAKEGKTDLAQLAAQELLGARNAQEFGAAIKALGTELGGLRAKMQELREQGRDPNEDAQQRALAYNKALKDVGDSIDALGFSLLKTFGPEIQTQAKLLQNDIDAIGRAGTDLATLWKDTIGPVMQSAWAAFVADLKELWASIDWTGMWGSFTSAAKSAIDTVWGWLKDIRNSISNLTSQAPAATAPIPPRPMASGGHVRGPGSGTSDSILARLSNGEFVINAAATARFLPLLRAINDGMSAPLMPRTRFATGGLVMAEPAGGGTPVHLHIGGNSFPLNGAPSVVSALVVEAHRQHVRSAGVKPSWYGGR